jgi:hypothetical protein
LTVSGSRSDIRGRHDGRSLIDFRTVFLPRHVLFPKMVDVRVVKGRYRVASTPRDFMPPLFPGAPEFEKGFLDQVLGEVPILTPAVRELEQSIVMLADEVIELFCAIVGAVHRHGLSLMLGEPRSF